MPSMREPYEEPIDIGYVQQTWGVDRVRSVSVKPARRHELSLIAEGLVELGHPIPCVYYGQPKGHANGEIEPSEEDLAAGMSVRPYYMPRPDIGPSLAGSYDGIYAGATEMNRRRRRRYE